MTTLMIIFLSFLLLREMNESCFYCLEKHSLALMEIYAVGNGPTSLHNIIQVL